MEVPQIQIQEVVRHVTVPQVATQEVVRQVPVPQAFVQMVRQPSPVPQVMNSEKMSGSDRSSIPSFFSEGTSDGGRQWAAEQRDCRYSDAVDRRNERRLAHSLEGGGVRSEDQSSESRESQD